ncbi:formimidoylglutamase [Sporosarcina gallistercoris]|uniref:Formimidoylglutamase n=1 Tax=Sporosarcina gallistercoris TaxID=2762245 RepID=A0ABR8PMD9_9BACL|nr:formimidoylglutamase [Sporosarcina gallistercoris]MBD7909338.1 formimidoylglutamase [Sporosarcina gallistercoris]
MINATKPGIWSGRIDDVTNRAAFRLHQVMQLNTPKESATSPTCALIGFSSDEGVRRNNGRTGASTGPDSLRYELAKLPWRQPENHHIVDLGTIICEDGKLEDAQRELGQVVYRSLTANTIPVILGGGHETAFGHYLGVREFAGPEAKIGVINIDAHFDLRSYAEQPSSGTMFKQMLDMNANTSYYVLGIQEFGNTQLLFDEADRLGVHYITEVQLDELPVEQIYTQLHQFIATQDYIMLTLCSDVLDAAAAPGVSAPSPFGLSPKQVRELIRIVASEQKTLSFDISEINPLLDEGGRTVKLGAYLTNEAIVSLLGGIQNDN